MNESRVEAMSRHGEVWVGPFSESRAVTATLRVRAQAYSYEMEKPSPERPEREITAADLAIRVPLSRITGIPQV